MSSTGRSLGGAVAIYLASQFSDQVGDICHHSLLNLTPRLIDQRRYSGEYLHQHQ